MSSLNQLTNKHILLDTCFIIKGYQYSGTPYFIKVFEDLKKNNCATVINDFIKFEFMRGCKKKGHITDKQNYLNFFAQISLPARLEELTKTAINISNIYSNKNINNNQIGVTDIFNSSFLEKYNNDLLLLTLDNNDYPLIIHDRINIEVIDTDKEILTLGFYRFNANKFEQAIRDFPN